MRVLVLGAGFGGLQLSTRLSEVLGAEVDVVLIDQSDGFVFGFSKLDVMFGRNTAESVRHSYRDVVKPGVQFVRSVIREIDPSRLRVVTDTGTFDGDVIVVALGADLDPSATPGLLAAGHEFYTVDGAFAARDVLADFGGGRVVIAVTSAPFKCPPAPSETALLMHDFLTRRGLREASEIALVMPLGVPIPPSPAASDALLDAFVERRIAWYPGRTVSSLDPRRRTAVLTDGAELPFDLFLGVPKHRAPDVVVHSGLCTDGWIPVDPLTLETSFPNVYAVGDVTSVGTPKAGVFAERQATVVADHIIARHRQDRSGSTYDGRGICYLEFGDDRVARVDVTFRAGEAPSGQFDAPSGLLAADKAAFGTDRILRWFGREWKAL